MLSLLGLPLCASATGAMPIKHSRGNEGLAALRTFEGSHPSMGINVICIFVRFCFIYASQKSTYFGDCVSL